MVPVSTPSGLVSKSERSFARRQQVNGSWSWSAYISIGDSGHMIGGVFHPGSHHNDLAPIVNQMCLDQYTALVGRNCLIQIFHTNLWLPYKGSITSGTCGRANHSARGVNIKSAAAVPPLQHAQILHSAGLRPQKCAHASSSRIANYVAGVVNSHGDAQGITG